MTEPKPIPVLLVCPECGADMTHLDPDGHSLVHYPDYLDPVKSSLGARKNQLIIRSGGATVEVYLKKFVMED